jgi:hypothetical protein
LQIDVTQVQSQAPSWQEQTQPQAHFPVLQQAHIVESEVSFESSQLRLDDRFIVLTIFVTIDDRHFSMIGSL